MPLKAASAHRANLRLLLIMRLVLLAGATIAANESIAAFGAHVDLKRVLATAGILLLVSAWSWARIARGNVISDNELHAQIIIDIIGLSVILHSAGGASSPFTLLYLIPVSIAAAALNNPRATWSVVGLSAVCYTSLLMFPDPLLPHIHNENVPSAVQLHLWGMWVGIISSSCLIAYFAVSARRMISERDNALSKQRERAIRDSQLVELGTLAAGAAHGLGTPLGTLALLADDLQHDYADNADLQKVARIMKDQITRCKDSLAVLSTHTNQHRVEAGGLRPADVYLSQILQVWRQTRTDATISVDIENAHPAPNLIADLTLTHALTNILNNAADVSPHCVEVNVSWSDSVVRIDVKDRGAGWNPDAMAKLGKTVFTTKGGQGGLGIGAFLAYATIDRLNGEVNLLRREGGGTCIQITLKTVSASTSESETSNKENGHGDPQNANRNERKTVTTG